VNGYTNSKLALNQPRKGMSACRAGAGCAFGLKGVAGNLGAGPVQAAVAAVEKLLRDGSPADAANPALGQLAAVLSRHGLAVAGGRLENTLAGLIFSPKTNPANERLAQHLWAHRDDLFTFLRQPGLDATNWRAELAIRFGVMLRKVWGGSRTWAGARAQSVLMSVWRTCWQQGRSALDFLSLLLRGVAATLAMPP
jgi:hypothetical protein